MLKQYKQEEEVKVNQFIPKVITGGKEPPGIIGEGTWLDRLELGTGFFVRNARDPLDFVLGLFCLKGRQGKVTVLITPDHEKDIYVDATRFCNKFSCHEVLGQFYTPPEEKGEEDERNRVQGDGDGPSGELERPAGEQEELQELQVRDLGPGDEHR